MKVDGNCITCLFVAHMVILSGMKSVNLDFHCPNYLYEWNSPYSQQLLTSQEEWAFSVIAFSVPVLHQLYLMLGV